MLVFIPQGLFAQEPRPLDRTEILGRLAMGYSPSYIAHLAKTNGVSFSPSPDFISQIQRAGGDGVLVERLSAIDSLSVASPSADMDAPVDRLAKCAEFIHIGDVEAALPDCRASMIQNPKSGWALLITAAIIQRPGDDEIREECLKLLRQAVGLNANLVIAREALATLTSPANVGAELHRILTTDTSEYTEMSASLRVSPDDRTAAMISFAEWAHAGEGVASLPSGEPFTINPVTLQRLQNDPARASSHIALANQYSQEGQDFEKARDEFRQAIKLEPDNSGFHIQLARLYFQYHDTEASLAELRQAVTIAPFGVMEHLNLAGALEKLRRTPEAIRELQLILVAHPASVGTSQTLVDLYVQHHDNNSAIAELRRSLQVSSSLFSDQSKYVDDRLEDLYRLASLLSESRDWDGATEQFLFLLRFKGDVAGVHNDFGNVLLAQGRLDQAIGEYSEAVRLDPQMASAQCNIGLCQFRKKNLDAAITEFRRAMELNSNEPDAQIYLGTALGLQGDSAAAKEQLEQALAKNPNDPETHLNAAFAYDQLKNSKGEIEELKRALELQPDSADAKNDLAWVYATAEDAKVRNPREALRLAREAVDSSPDPNPAFIDTLAEAQLLNGQPAQALTSETEALKLDPQNAELLTRLARFREAAQSHNPSTPNPR